jgi:hypothetical protein
LREPWGLRRLGRVLAQGLDRNLGGKGESAMAKDRAGMRWHPETEEASVTPGEDDEPGVSFGREVVEGDEELRAGDRVSFESEGGWATKVRKI